MPTGGKLFICHFYRSSLKPSTPTFISRPAFRANVYNAVYCALMGCNSLDIQTFNAQRCQSFFSEERTFESVYNDTS